MKMILSIKNGQACMFTCMEGISKTGISNVLSLPCRISTKIAHSLVLLSTATYWTWKFQHQKNREHQLAAKMYSLLCASTV